jgi:glucan-binding YG repeat protein
MRFAVGMLMCLGGLSAAWANDPPSRNPAAAAPTATPSAAPAASSATAPASAPAATTSASGNAPAPAAAPANASAQSAKNTELTEDEKKYLSHGYKLQIRSGQKYFCHSESQLGTRFATTVCRTAEQMAAATQNSKDFASEMERPNGNRVGR